VLCGNNVHGLHLEIKLHLWSDQLYTIEQSLEMKVTMKLLVMSMRPKHQRKRNSKGKRGKLGDRYSFLIPRYKLVHFLLLILFIIKDTKIFICLASCYLQCVFKTCVKEHNNLNLTNQNGKFLEMKDVVCIWRFNKVTDIYKLCKLSNYSSNCHAQDRITLRNTIQTWYSDIGEKYIIQDIITKRYRTINP